MEIKKYSLVDQVYEKLHADIVQLEIPLGARINVNELQEELAVSCTPIREALNRLQQEGLVVYENKIGARVISLAAHDVVEIQQLAVTLHCAAIRLALENGDREKIVAELTERLMEYRQAVTERAEVEAVSAFLGVYYHNCGNSRLDSGMLSIQSQHLLLCYLYASFMKERAGSAPLFEAMLEGTVRGDADAVCKALAAYTDEMTSVLLAHMQ